MKMKRLLLIPVLILASLKLQAQITPNSDNVLYVNKAVTGGDQSGNSWTNAISELSDALKWVRQEVNNTASWLPNDSIQIYVAEGTYTPLYNAADNSYTTDGGRKNAFVMIKNVQIYGGFPNTGDPTFEERDWEQFSTVLSGDIGVQGTNADNTYQVIVSAADVGNALIDGFTVKDGVANEGNATSLINGQDVKLRWGGGVYVTSSSSPTFRNLNITQNYAFYGGGMLVIHNSHPVVSNVAFLNNHAAVDGGAMFNEDNSNPIISNTHFINNKANNSGGAIYNWVSSPALTDVAFENNSCGVDGGALNNYKASSIIKNATFENNKAAASGGAVFNNESRPTFMNALFVGNSAASGGAIYNHNPTATSNFVNITVVGNLAKDGGGFFNNGGSRTNIYNSIVYGNMATGNGNNIQNSGSTNIPIAHSLIGGSNTWMNAWGSNNGDNIALESGNLDVFIDPLNNNFTLKSTSPAVDAGSNSRYQTVGGNLSNDTDLLGNARVHDFGNAGVIDMGAFEFFPFSIGNSDNFVTVWEVESQDLKIVIPTDDNFDYLYRLYWENTTDNTINNTLYGLIGNDTITFPSAGTYRVEIAEKFPSVQFNNEGSKEKIHEVKQWGTNEWKSLEGAFWGANNLEITATDIPDFSQVTNMAYAFALTDINTVSDINNWNLDNVTDMSGVFSGAASFNQDISNWNVENVTKMDSMFTNATDFNQDISSWNIENVIDMSSMFSGATSFNQSISNWNVENVTNMSSMFSGATSFNQDISSWNVENVTDMSSMFSGATSFNQNISSWDIVKVTDMSNLFSGATSFDQNISSWNVENITDMSGMFSGAASFNQDISSWDVSNVSDMDNLLKNAVKFDQNIGAWDLSSLSNEKISIENTALSCTNYTNTLIGWADNPTSFHVTLNATGLTHGNDSTVIASRNGLTTFLKWTIIGDIQGDCFLSVDEFESSSINVYPNPANDFITIEGLQSKATIQLLDVSGKIVKTYFIGSSEEKIELSKLSNGFYNLIINTENGQVYTKKILKS